MDVELGSVRTELSALRRGQALGRPQSCLALSQNLRLHLAGPQPSEPQAAFAVTAALRDAIDRLSDADRQLVAAEFNIDSQHAYPTLTQRQESLASALRCTSKTVRRRTDKAMTALAIVVAAGAHDTARTQIVEQSVDAGLRRFWRLGTSATVDVVCSEIPAEELPEYAFPGDRNYLRYAKFADLDTLIYVRTRLAQLAPDAQVRDFSPSEHHDTQAAAMIVIGGPPWNAKYREFLPQLPYHFEPHPLGEDDPLVIPQLGDLRIGPRWSVHSELVEDIAVFTRLTLSSGTTVFLLGGCLTAGVLGAARTFLHGDLAAANTAWLAERVGEDDDVVVVAEARRIGGMTDAADITGAGPIVVLRRPRSAHRFETVVDNRRGP